MSSAVGGALAHPKGRGESAQKRKGSGTTQLHPVGWTRSLQRRDRHGVCTMRMQLARRCGNDRAGALHATAQGSNLHCADAFCARPARAARAQPVSDARARAPHARAMHARRPEALSACNPCDARARRPRAVRARARAPARHPGPRQKCVCVCVCACQHLKSAFGVNLDSAGTKTAVHLIHLMRRNRCLSPQIGRPRLGPADSIPKKSATPCQIVPLAPMFARIESLARPAPARRCARPPISRIHVVIRHP